MSSITVEVQSQKLNPQVDAFRHALEKIGATTSNQTILFSINESIPSEGFAIEVGQNRILVKASTTAGAAYAASELVRQADINPSGNASWNKMVYEDAPDFPYRSFMVDMGRNPHSPETLRHVIDMMWFYKGNYLQLHLTDDQLFSWPSKAYPELYSSRAGWSLEDFQALEVYSQARGVTIVPELDVPGHSTILRTKRPDVFGKTTMDLATTSKAQKGVETLIAEMLDIFQTTPYMHIGADEVFGVPQEEQRKFINRLNEFIKSKGKTTVVWEGPAAGSVEKRQTKVNEDIIHMAWESKYYPMTEMVKAGYSIVNASWDPFYVVDHYPRNNFTGVPVDLIYKADFRRLKNVDPRIKSFNHPQWADNTDSILGFCMPWWEGREFNLLPLCLKRFAAASTRAWNYNSSLPYNKYAAREDKLLSRLESISGFTIPAMPMAKPEQAQRNLAYRAQVMPSSAEHQPHFVPARLTNGITDQFDLFLGYPTKPKPLIIDIRLLKEANASRIRIHEMAVGGGWEKYRLFISADGNQFTQVGKSSKGLRGENKYLDHRFDKAKIKVVRIETDGFEDFTFPSFSRLTEVQVFAE